MGFFSKIFKVKDTNPMSPEEMESLAKEAAETAGEPGNEGTNVVDLEAGLTPEQLAKERNADMEIVLISAWLHDIASIKGHYEDHHIIGQEYAQEFLKKNNYPREKIKQVKHCIFAHRGSKDIKREYESKKISYLYQSTRFNKLLCNMAIPGSSKGSFCTKQYVWSV